MKKTGWTTAMAAAWIGMLGPAIPLAAEDGAATAPESSYAREVVVRMLVDRGVAADEARLQADRMNDDEALWFAENPEQLQVGRGLRLDELTGGVAMLVIGLGGTYAWWRHRKDYLEESSP